MRKLGVRFRKLQASAGIFAHPAAMGNVSVFDVETGESIDGIKNVSVRYDTGDVIMADITLFVAAVDVIEDKA
jgi:hypothetical protein